MLIARRAAQLGAKVAVIEFDRLGGTCVNRGCIPKKLLYNASTIYSSRELFPSYKVMSKEDPESIPFDWSAYKQKMDAYILRLNGIYERNLNNDKIQTFLGRGEILGRQIEGDDASPILVAIQKDAEHHSESVIIATKKLCIATGSHPVVPKIEGAEHGITSDNFFKLTTRPNKVVVVGAGYIAVELATSLAHLGAKEIHLCTRGDRILKAFDEMISQEAVETLRRTGIEVAYKAAPEKIVKEANGTLSVHLPGGRVSLSIYPPSLLCVHCETGAQRRYGHLGDRPSWPLPGPGL